ncbi:lactonase family protein [Salinimicrobium sp. CAU 1759]
MKTEQIFFVGTYQQSGPYVPEAKGKGLLSCSLHLETGEIRQEHVCKKPLNSTYLSMDGKGQLFAAGDNFENFGEVHVFSIEEDASLIPIAAQTTFGTSSCHVACDKEGKRIFVSSYANGVLSQHIFNGASLTLDPEVLVYQGSGPNAERQEAAHIHQAVVSPNGRWLYTCDLGSDKVWLHDLRYSGNLKLIKGISVPSGSGPRHLVCHPQFPLVYVFCELDAGLLTYQSDSETGDLELISQMSTLPENFTGQPAGAAIRLHPSGRALYVSNRNHHSLTAFSLEGEGRPVLHSTFSIEGEEPRDFNIDPSGQWLLSANQNSSTIVPFRLDAQTGLPTGAQGPKFDCGTPVCILFN